MTHQRPYGFGGGMSETTRHEEAVRAKVKVAEILRDGSRRRQIFFLINHKTHCKCKRWPAGTLTLQRHSWGCRADAGAAHFFFLRCMFSALRRRAARSGLEVGHTRPIGRTIRIFTASVCARLTSPARALRPNYGWETRNTNPPVDYERP